MLRGGPSGWQWEVEYVVLPLPDDEDKCCYYIKSSTPADKRKAFLIKEDELADYKKNLATRQADLEKAMGPRERNKVSY